MKPSVYIETTVVSYLTAWPSKEPIRAAHQEITRRWWEYGREEVELYVSSLVIAEAGRGDPSAAKDRLAALQGIAILEMSIAEYSLSEKLVSEGAIPRVAEADALHVSTSAIHGIDYLLTWNCTHIANAKKRQAIEKVCRSEGFEPPVICTPAELLGEDDGT